MAMFHPDLLYHISHPFLRRYALLQCSSHVSWKLRLISKNLNCVQCSVSSVSWQQLTPYNCFYLESNYPESREFNKGSCFPVHEKYVPLLSINPYGSVESTLILWSLAFHRGGPCLLPSRSMGDLLGRKCFFPSAPVFLFSIIPPMVQTFIWHWRLYITIGTDSI
jgi:hypothetical protein